MAKQHGIPAYVGLSIRPLGCRKTEYNRHIICKITAFSVYCTIQDQHGRHVFDIHYGWVYPHEFYGWRTWHSNKPIIFIAANERVKRRGNPKTKPAKRRRPNR